MMDEHPVATDRDSEPQVAATRLALLAIVRPHGHEIAAEALRVLADHLDMELGEVIGMGDGAPVVQRASLGWEPEAAAKAPGPERRAEISHLLGRPGVALLPDLESAAPFEPSELLAHHGVRSMLGVRIDDEGHPAGVLALYSARPRPMGHSDARFLEAIAAVLVAVLQRGRVEVEVRQSQKLEAIGQLASGIAHEINTPIQFIGDNVQFLRDAFAGIRGLLTAYAGWLPEGAAEADGRREADEAADLAYLDVEVPTALDQTLDGVERVATIVRALKDFAHPDDSERTPTDLNRAIQSTLTVANNQLKYVAEVETDLGEIPPVVCHAGELQQVFLNLIINAAHAIADARRDDGRLGRIRVRSACDGEWVVVTVSDDGGGIPVAIQPRIFEPFFTTKDVGRGTGQGLALSRSVVSAHQGVLSFESREGVGTTFTVRLPIGRTAADDDARETA